MSEPSVENRRPLKSRSSGWAQGLAKALAGAGASPNMISGLSVVFAIAGFGLFCRAGLSDAGMRSGYLMAAAVCIQLRLLCNLLDGMVAVEYGRGSTSGPIWNELPDRFADALFLAGAGLSVAFMGHLLIGMTLGWLAAVLAVTTAYVRELGRGLGQPADFSGPMAKPHRMAALTLTCVVSAAEPLWRGQGQILLAGLTIIVLGTAITVARRTRTLARLLAAAKSPHR